MQPKSDTSFIVDLEDLGAELRPKEGLIIFVDPNQVLLHVVSPLRTQKQVTTN